VSTTYWMKLYMEILDDRKMATLPDHLWRRCIEIFMIAKNEDGKGLLPAVADMAWTLRTSEEDVVECLVALAEEGREIVYCQEGLWYVTKYEERQGPSPVQERVARYRERQRHSNGVDNGSVTKRNACNAPEAEAETEAETEEEAETEAERADAPAAPPAASEKELDELFAFVCREFDANMAKLTPRLRDELLELAGTYPTRETWEYAFGECARYNKRVLPYLERCLKTWKDGRARSPGPPAVEDRRKYVSGKYAAIFQQPGG